MKRRHKVHYLEYKNKLKEQLKPSRQTLRLLPKIPAALASAVSWPEQPQKQEPV